MCAGLTTEIKCMGSCNHICDLKRDAATGEIFTPIMNSGFIKRLNGVTIVIYLRLVGSYIA